MPSVIDTGLVGFMFNSSSSYPYLMSEARIITGSCASMTNNFAGGSDIDDAWLVFPGYKLILYDLAGHDVSGGTKEIDNTQGQYPKMFHFTQNINKTASFKAFYKGGGQLPDMSGNILYTDDASGPP